MTWTGAHHTFVGDLVATVSIGGISVDLIRRPTNGGGGDSRNLNGTYTFDDDATASFNSLPLPATEYPAGSSCRKAISTPSTRRRRRPRFGA